MNTKETLVVPHDNSARSGKPLVGYVQMIRVLQMQFESLLHCGVVNASAASGYPKMILWWCIKKTNTFVGTPSNQEKGSLMISFMEQERGHLLNI